MSKLLNYSALQNAGQSNLHLVPVNLDPETVGGDNTETILFVHLWRWIENEASGKVYTFKSTGVFEVDDDDSTVMYAFEKQADATAFSEWWDKVQGELFSWEDWKLVRLWPDDEDFAHLMKRKEPVSAQAYIEYDLGNFDEDGEITQEVFQIWNWTQNNCQDMVFRWYGEFVFSSKKDATLFKLRWLGDNEDEIT
jgi:hypothetical protein